MARTKLTVVVDEVRPLAGSRMTLGDIVMGMSITSTGEVREVKYESGIDNFELRAEFGSKNWNAIIRMDDEAFDKYIQTETAVRRFVRKVNKFQ